MARLNDLPPGVSQFDEHINPSDRPSCRDPKCDAYESRRCACGYCDAHCFKNCSRCRPQLCARATI